MSKISTELAKEVTTIVLRGDNYGLTPDDIADAVKQELDKYTFRPKVTERYPRKTQEQQYRLLARYRDTQKFQYTRFNFDSQYLPACHGCVYYRQSRLEPPCSRCVAQLHYLGSRKARNYWQPINCEERS